MRTDIRLGIFGGNVGALASSRSGEVAVYAEKLGYASMWTAEHVVLPRPREHRPPLDPDWPIADPLLSLSYLAASTSTIKLCTGVLVATQRHPIRLAKEAATLDVLSRGRFVLGVGLGYIRQEFEALGIPRENRRERFREYLDAMNVLWNDPEPAFSGRFVSFEGIDAHPRPVTRGGPPLVMGGYADAALDDAAQRASGWYGFGLAPDDARSVIKKLREKVERAERDPEKFEVSMTPRIRLTPKLVEQYREVGVDQLVVSVETNDFDGARRRLDYNAPAKLGIG